MAASRLWVELSRDLLVCFGENLLLDALPLPILRVEQRGQFGRFTFICRQQEMQRLFGGVLGGRPHSGAAQDGKPMSSGGDRRTDCRHFHQLPEPRTLRPGDLSKAALDEHSIFAFATERCRPRSQARPNPDAAFRSKLCQRPSLEQRVAKLENNPNAAEITKGAFSLDLRIHHRDAIGQCRFRLVMIERR